MSDIIHIDGWPQPYPQLDAVPYWAALQEQRLIYQRCSACNEAVWPAHLYCPHCGAAPDLLAWHDACGRGTVYSFSTVMRGPTPTWAAIAPYTVGFIEMAEGYHLFSQIEARPEEIRIGQAVQVRFLQRGAQILPVFAPSD